MKTVSKPVVKEESKSGDRARKSAQAQMYAPRPVRAQPVPQVEEDMRLRRLTAQVLEELKLPGAIPSRIVQAALTQAKALRG